MASLEYFILRVKPALEAYLRAPTELSLQQFEKELSHFSHIPNTNILNKQVLIPLILNVDELGSNNENLRTSCLQCITLVISNAYLKECTALRTVILIVLKQIKADQNISKASTISEEMKLAAVECMTISLKRSTTDVLEQFYTKESDMILGQILLTLVELIEREKYKVLVTACLKCIMTVFYVHDEADKLDVVLRNQVANILFIFLPKIVTVLYKTALGDDKLGDGIKELSINALGSILCLIFEDTTEDRIGTKHDADSFNKLISHTHTKEKKNEKIDMTDSYQSSKTKQKEQLQKLRSQGRTQNWMQTSARKLRLIFTRLSVLRSHTSAKLRRKYAEMCCLLITKCSYSLKDSFIVVLENVMALTEDENLDVKELCSDCLDQLQRKHSIKQMFDENAELLFEEHLASLPRLINQCDSNTQHAEFLFLKGFFKCLTSNTLLALLTIPQNMEGFLRCLLMAVKLKVSADLLNKEYHTFSLPENTFMKLPWRRFQNITCDRCINQLKDICQILGHTKTLNQLLLDHLMELYERQEEYEVTNNPGAFLIMLWLATPQNSPTQTSLTTHLLELLLNDKHWFLATEPDIGTQLKSEKPIKWISDHTPGLYESSIEIRTQDFADSDDDDDDDNGEYNSNRVTGVEAQMNVLHTCIILDAMGYCALHLDNKFSNYTFRSLYKILLKLADNNAMIHQAAQFTLNCVQKALKYPDCQHLIEQHMDYIEYRLNNLLKKNIDTQSALSILTVVVKFSSRHSVSYFEQIFQTICEQCTKTNQQQYITAYLRLFSNFLQEFIKWSENCTLLSSVRQSDAMAVQEMNEEDETNILRHWLEALLPIDGNFEQSDCKLTACNSNSCSDITANDVDNDSTAESTLPPHIVLVKLILHQVLKFISSTEKMHTILALECLIHGLPLLQHYDNVLLPMVHNIWKPFVQKLRQDDVIILNRCFKLLLCLAMYAKDFITKRCLDDVIPFLKCFLKKAASNSSNLDNQSIMTQEYKLQMELLEELPTIIECLEIDGKHLSEIHEIISLYISTEQPIKLQNIAVLYFTKLRLYNGPLTYIILLKKSRLKYYAENCSRILNEFI